MNLSGTSPRTMLLELYCLPIASTEHVFAAVTVALIWKISGSGAVELSAQARTASDAADSARIVYLIDI